jgi:Flp pilus assembly protein TadB
MRAGDSDRERATAALQEHYVGGRLTLEELSDRTGRVLAARSRAEIRRALSDLPVFGDSGELAARGRLLVHSVARSAMLVVFTGAYLVFSFVLLLVFGLTLLLNGASGTALVGFLVVWLVPTYLLSRLWRRPSAGGASTVPATRR